jgi:2'-5' RNA ligase
MTTRYAVYYAPDPASALWRFGSAVLGYDASEGQDVPPLLPAGFTHEEWARATSEPRRYGFHATIKAPFRPMPATPEGAVVEAAERIARALAPVDLGRCHVSVIPSSEGGGFVAITPAAPPAALAFLERSVVEGFEPLRAPPSDAERARRRPDRLTERQRLNLERYGYPYVLEEFAFHMTLSGRLDDPKPVAAELARLARDNGVGETMVVDRLSIFRQDGESSRFRILSSHPMAGAGR